MWLHLASVENRQISQYRKTPDAISCLANLFEQTQDGWVAYNLAEEFADAKHFREASRQLELANA